MRQTTGAATPGYRHPIKAITGHARGGRRHPKRGARPQQGRWRGHRGPGGAAMPDKDTGQTASAHACDNLRLSGKEFLYAVMRDPTLPIRQVIFSRSLKYPSPIPDEFWTFLY